MIIDNTIESTNKRAPAASKINKIEFEIFFLSKNFKNEVTISVSSANSDNKNNESAIIALILALVATS